MGKHTYGKQFLILSDHKLKVYSQNQPVYKYDPSTLAN